MDKQQDDISLHQLEKEGDISLDQHEQQNDISLDQLGQYGGISLDKLEQKGDIFPDLRVINNVIRMTDRSCQITATEERLH